MSERITVNVKIDSIIKEKAESSCRLTFVLRNSGILQMRNYTKKLKFCIVRCFLHHHESKEVLYLTTSIYMKFNMMITISENQK